MKKTILLFVALLIGSMSYAQSANGFNFKALVTEGGNPVASSVITVKVTFKEGSTTRWAETHSNVHTDANGIFSIKMGEGTRTGGVASFDKVNWNVGNMNYTVQVNTGSGYHTLVSNEYFKIVPYAKMAERLRTSEYDVVTVNSNIQAINDGSGTISHGFKLSHGTDDWYMYMKNNDDLAISNDGYDKFVISDSDDSVWMKKLKINSNSTGTNAYSIYKANDGLRFNYNSATAMKFHGSASVEVMGKLRAPSSGDADMKAYAYGYVSSTGSIVGGTGNFTVTKTATGVYEITLTGVTSLSPTDIFVIATPSADAMSTYIRTYILGNKINVKTMVGSSNSNEGFTFVVYKK